MEPDKFSGQELTIVCRGFKNPIYEKIWQGFFIIFFDSEPSRNPIEQSESVGFNAVGFTPAQVEANTVIIKPSIFRIASESIWKITVSVFPIPLELECFVRLTIPSDLYMVNVAIQGFGMFKPRSGTVIDEVQDRVDGTTKQTVVTFPSCQSAGALGVSPQGRLEINRISTPPSRRNTGAFQLEIFKDALYTSKIAELDSGIIIDASDLEPGFINDISVVPSNLGVQEITSYTITFTTDSTLFAGSDVTI